MVKYSSTVCGACRKLEDSIKKSFIALMQKRPSWGKLILTVQFANGKPTNITTNIEETFKPE
jgi:hypothetical protein